MKSATRKKPGRIETRLSMALMAILVIIGAGVFMRQYQFNPAVIALRPESRQPTQLQASESQILVDVGQSGIEPFSQPERFDPDTLYEKINGRADLYLSSGFASLETQRFTADPAAGTWVELFVYDMGTPENAFSVFSTQRRDDARSDDIATHAYRTENALFIASANMYLELIGTDASPPLQAAMDMLARAYLGSRISGKETVAPGSDRFPPDGIVKDSLQLITANAFGYEQLDTVYTTDYSIDGTRLTAFVSRRPDAASAAHLADKYRRILVSYGAESVSAGTVEMEGADVLQIFDTYEIVFSRGPFLAGIHEADGLEAAAALARQLADHLENRTEAGADRVEHE